MKTTITFLASLRAGDMFQLDPQDQITYMVLWPASKPGYITCSDLRDGRRVMFHQALEVSR